MNGYVGDQLQILVEVAPHFGLLVLLERLHDWVLPLKALYVHRCLLQLEFHQVPVLLSEQEEFDSVLIGSDGLFDAIAKKSG